MNLNATILGQIISFVLFVWICMQYVWIPFISVIEKRQKKISDDLQSIKQSKIESEKINEKALFCLSQAKIQAEEILKRAYACQEQILNAAQEEAKKERNRILLQAELQINQEKRRVSDELRKKMGQFIVMGAEKVIHKSIDKFFDYDFINSVIKTLPPYED